MLQLLSIIIIHSTPFDELAQGVESPDGRNESYSLKGDKSIQAAQIRFSGNQAISTQQLEKLVRASKKMILSETDLYEIKKRVELLYRVNGYENARVTMPNKQKSEILEIVIFEGEKSQ